MAPEVCRYFQLPRGCHKGTACKFLHVKPEPVSAESSQRKPQDHKDQPTMEDKQNDEAFYKWRRLIPRASAGRPQSYGAKLSQFFQNAYTLVQTDLNMLQKTVTELATEQGALAVRELIDERILYCYTDHDRVTLWRTCIRPFFQILTEPRVTQSAILEVHTGTIYNVISGRNAGRLEILFNYLRDLAMNWQPPLIGDQDESKSEFLEVCANILAKTIDSNTHTIVNDVIPPNVTWLRESIDSLGEGHNFWRLQATKHLEYVQRRLGIVKGIAEDRASTIPLPSQAHFTLRRDLPGKLSTEGPRHDNDSDDITEIRILPTMSEIMATRDDYRPFHDPTQLHLPGIQGLIDRHFRLLRDDMIGQLKECVNEELRLLDHSENGTHPENGTIVKQQHGIRTNSYSIVDIQDITCSRRAGIEFHLKIEQPISVGILTREAREDWWELSKRLEIGALVCLLEKGTAVFCVVSESTVRPNLAQKTTPKVNDAGEILEKRNLHSNKDFAYVNLNLAEPTETDLGVMLRAFQSGQPAQRSLVEFPGILLPSFKPTLSALQQIFKSLDIPFADLLAPSSDGPAEVSIPPPLYSTKPQFKYNLKCLTSDGENLLFSPYDTPDPQELCSRSSLDEGQAIALLNVLRRSLALIQGPPGTGKSYTGEVGLERPLLN